MQRIKWVDERLEQWALWREGAGSYRAVSYDSIGGGGIALNVVEMNADQEAKCIEIDKAIAGLPLELKKTVMAFYLWEGGVQVIAEKLRVTRATVHRRLCHADLRIIERVSYE